MKSKIQEHHKNNFKRLSKSTSIYLGILVTINSNSIFANDSANKQNYQ